MCKKKIKKKMKCIMLILFCIVLLPGCYSKKEIILQQQKTNEHLPQIRYKSSVDASYGQMAAMYDGDLYYYSSKKDGAGIYKCTQESEKESDSIGQWNTYGFSIMRDIRKQREQINC